MKVLLIRFVLNILHTLDQQPRKNYIASNSKTAKWLYGVFAHYTAKINRVILGFILKYNGWPSISQYGHTASEAAFYILQHAPHGYMEKHAYLMRNAVCAQEASVKYFAMLQDRLLMHRGRKQIYGTQYSRRSSREDFKLWPVVNPRNLDKRRAKAGLSSTDDA